MAGRWRLLQKNRYQTPSVAGTPSNPNTEMASAAVTSSTVIYDGSEYERVGSVDVGNGKKKKNIALYEGPKGGHCYFTSKVQTLNGTPLTSLKRNYLTKGLEIKLVV
eukprot:gene22606-28742_t